MGLSSYMSLIGGCVVANAQDYQNRVCRLDPRFSGLLVDTLTLIDLYAGEMLKPSSLTHSLRKEFPYF